MACSVYSSLIYSSSCVGRQIEEPYLALIDFGRRIKELMGDVIFESAVRDRILLSSACFSLPAVTIYTFFCAFKVADRCYYSAVVFWTGWSTSWFGLKAHMVELCERCMSTGLRWLLLNSTLVAGGIMSYLRPPTAVLIYLPAPLLEIFAGFLWLLGWTLVSVRKLFWLFLYFRWILFLRLRFIIVVFRLMFATYLCNTISTVST